MNKIELTESELNSVRMTVRDLVHRAYEAGQTSHDDVPLRDEVAKPNAEEVNDAIQTLERRAVILAHARMEETAKLCGFEGLTEALGYLITLRDNPLAELLREAINLCSVGDITPSEDVADEGGWSNWMYRAKAAVGDTVPPPDVPTIHYPTTFTSPKGERSTIGDKPPAETTVHTATGEALDTRLTLRDLGKELNDRTYAYARGMVEAHETALDRLEVEAPRSVGMRPELAAGFDSPETTWPQISGRVRSGCAVRDVIQSELGAGPLESEQTGDAAADTGGATTSDK